MGTLFAAVFVLGLLSGLDPLAFLAVLVVSAQHRRNGVAFVAGWLLTLISMTLIPGAILHVHPREHHAGTHRPLVSWVLLIVGLILVALAGRAWMARRDHDPEHIPRWYARLRKVGPKTSFLTGLILPSFPAAIAAGATIFRSHLHVGGRIAAVAVFWVVSSAIVIVPVVLLFAMPRHAPPMLERVSGWVFRERHVITFWVLGSIGVFLVVRSLLHLLR